MRLTAFGWLLGLVLTLVAAGCGAGDTTKDADSIPALDTTNDVLVPMAGDAGAKRITCPGRAR